MRAHIGFERAAKGQFDTVDSRAGHEKLAPDRVFRVSVALEIVVWELGHNILLLVDFFDRLFYLFFRVVL